MAKIKARYLASDTYAHDYYKEVADIYVAHTLGGISEIKVNRSRGECLYSKGGTTYFDAPIPSRVVSFYEELENAPNPSAVTDILKKQFIIECLNETECVNALHLDCHTERQGNFYSYGEMIVRPALEALLLADPERMQQLLSKASTEIKNEIFAHFKEIQLAEDESISFAGFNLVGVSFKGAQLGKSSFKDAKVKEAVFDNANLSHTDITEEQLDQTKSYDNALLPKGFFPFWNDEFKEKLQDKLNKLRAYAVDKIPTQDEKYNLVLKICDSSREKLKIKNVPTQAKKQILESFINKETTQKLYQGRNLKYLVGEIVAFLLLAGLGYLIAGSLSKWKTGRFGLFTQPKTAAQANGIAQTINEHKSSFVKIRRC